MNRFLLMESLPLFLPILPIFLVSFPVIFCLSSSALNIWNLVSEISLEQPPSFVKLTCEGQIWASNLYQLCVHHYRTKKCIKGALGYSSNAVG